MADELSSRSLYLAVVEVTSLIILNVLSLTGNTLVCISVYKNTRLRTTTNLYIIALAVSDLLSAVFVMPFGTGVLLTGKWIFGGVFCQFHAFFSLFVIYVSPVTMGLTAVNRYVRMCKSDRQYKKLFSAHKSRALLGTVWLFVACYTVVPRLAGLQAYEFVQGYAQCSIAHLSESGKLIHYGIVLTLFFLTPLMATIISYIKVARMIKQHNADALYATQRRELCCGLYCIVTYLLCTSPLGDIVRAHGLAYHFYADDSQLYCSFKLQDQATSVRAIESCLNDIDGKLNKKKKRRKNS